jgi:A/G-specific adenine glycosylase
MTQKATVEALVAWFARNARPLPWRNTRDPYAIWVSEVMLQQTQVKTVLPYWERWMLALPRLEDLAKAKPEKLHKLWEGLGYYTRVRNLQRAAAEIMQTHDGRFPERFEEVLALPGIGRYTAGAICSIAFNQAQPILDGNVARVLARLFGIGEDPRAEAGRAKLWRLAQELVEEASRIHPPRACSRGPGRAETTGACSCFNESLMELGALVCTPKEPRCGVCPVGVRCVARLEGRVAELPLPVPRARVTRRRFAAFLVRSGKRFLVRQRPAGVINAHLWEFPNVELAEGDADLARAAHTALGVRGVELVRLGTLRHSITRYRITLELYEVRRDQTTAEAAKAGCWLTKRQLAKLPLAAVHKKVLEGHLGT